MDSPELTLFMHSLDLTAQLVQRFCVVAMAALLCIRLKGLRTTLRGSEKEWKHRFPMILIFGYLGVLATHSGIVVDVHQEGLAGNWAFSSLPSGIGQSQAIVSFRDTIVLSAGLVGGPWVGLGAGVIAGIERCSVGGFAALAAGTATLALGVFAGFARKYRPNWSWYSYPIDTISIAIFGSLLQRVIILGIVEPHNDAITLSWKIAFPVAMVNIIGCVLFRAVERDLERDQLEMAARESKLQALQAQIDPHFLNNALNDVNDLIATEPDKAMKCVSKLARFFNDTREAANVNTITLDSELKQVNRYLDFRNLSFSKDIDYREVVPESLRTLFIPSRCLMTMAENTFKHGFQGRPAPYKLSITAKEDGGNIILVVKDNGNGIPPERLVDICKRSLHSDRGGGGVALFHLRQSLELAFHGQAKLAINSQVNGGTEIVISLPKRNEPW